MNRAVGGAIVAICVLAFGLRLAIAAITVGLSTPAVLEPASDSRIHVSLVHSLLSGRGFSIEGIPTATTPPLYVFFLAGIYLISPHPALVRVIQAGLGALTCLLVYEVGRRLFDRLTGLAAAALLAMLPHAVYVSGLHLTENLFLVLLLLVIFQSSRIAQRPTWHGAFLLGVIIGLVALTRALFLLFLPVMLVWVGVLWGSRRRMAVQIFACVTAGMIVALVPWTARNAIAIGSPVPVQSNGGMVFWAGNNRHSAGGMVWPTAATWDAGEPPDDGNYGWRDLTISDENRVFVRAALIWIASHPGDYASLVAAKLVRLYRFTRAADGEYLAVPLGAKLYHMVFLVLALVGAVMEIARWRTLFLIFALVVFVNVTVALFSGGARYSIPMIPALSLFAGAALTAAWNAIVRNVVRSRLSTEPTR